jgi:hypothetical protein
MMRHDLSLVLSVLLATSSAYAQATGAEIDACVATATGRVRILDAGGVCKRKERALSWNAQGPAGTPGTTGLQGPQGDPGASGPSGPPSCRTVGRLTIAGIVGDGAGGTMAVYAYHVALEAAPVGGPPAIVDFSVTKPIDKASPALAQAMVAGTIAPTGKLEIFAADGITVVTTYDLAMVAISSLTGGSSSACTSDLPVDTLSLSVLSITAS